MAAAESARSFLELRNVSKIFPASRERAPLHALGPIDLELRRGEFFAVVGPSGCGKSTLLELIAGLTAPSEGSLAFEGKPIAGEAPEGIGVVFQDDASLPWLNVAENGCTRERDSRIVERAEFGAITARLWKSLREESMKTIGRTTGAAAPSP